MPKKKSSELKKTAAKAADLILDLLAELPPEQAKAAGAEISALALKSSRSATRGKVLPRRKTAGFRLSRHVSAKPA